MTMKKVVHLRKILFILISIVVATHFAVCNTRAEEAPEKTKRIEVSYSFENLQPHSIYGNWNTGNFAFYDKRSPDFTYFLQSSVHSRDDGNGVTGTVGAYKDWTDYLYTYSAITAGSHSTYLPKFRWDHDFNFKVGPNKNLVLTAGITYIDYFDVHRDLILSGGPTLYLDKWVLQYRLFHNESNPGSVESYSHLISAGYGKEGWQWTYLNISFGKQAYMATSLATPEAVNQNSLNVTLKHRHWLAKDYGIFGDVSYFKLQDGYKKYGISSGFFYEF
jgi:YaiO family outer membrane protein